MELRAEEFLRRFLLHVVPTGFVRIRHYGLFANRSRTATIARCRRLLGVADPPAPPTHESGLEKLLRWTGVDLHLCPACGEGRLCVIAELEPSVLPLARIERFDSS